jgi:hypothetical protein
MKFANKTLIFIIIVLSSNNLSSQVSSETIDWFWTSGKITRTSNIVDGKRVYNGTFNYSGKGINFPNVMTVNGNYKNNKFDGDFILSRKGPLHHGNCEYLAKGKFISDTMDGQWLFKSKSINDAYESYDFQFKINFDKGNILSLERIDNIENIKENWRGDNLGFINGIQKVEYKENGYLVRMESNFVHGIQIWNKKIDVASGQLLGKIKYLADTNLVNEQNFKYKTLIFKNLTADSLENEIEKKILKIEENKIWKDSIKSKNSMVKDLIQDSLNISKKYSELELLYLNAKNDSLKNEESISEFKANSQKISIYYLIKDYKTLKNSVDVEKSIEKLKKYLVNNNKINNNESIFILKSNLNPIIISFSLDRDSMITSYRQLDLYEDETKKFNSIITKNEIILDQNTEYLLYKYTGLNERYFEQILKRKLYTDIHVNFKQTSMNLKEEIEEFERKKKSIYLSIQNCNIKIDEINTLEKSIAILRNQISSNSIKIYKCKNSDCCPIENYFTSLNELKELMNIIGPAGNIIPCRASIY